MDGHFEVVGAKKGGSSCFLVKEGENYCLEEIEVEDHHF